MSWNNALPLWIYQLEYEHFLASSTCCFNDEWFSGFSRELPTYVILQALRRQNETEDVVKKDYESL